MTLTVYTDLVVALLEAGLSPGGAIRMVEDQLVECGLVCSDGAEVVHEALALARETGVGPSALARAGARQRRRGQVAAIQTAAQRLSVMILLPMGLCLLPAFMVMTVVPLVIGLLR